jgi:outer membrane lipoprotein SlyB
MRVSRLVTALSATACLLTLPGIVTTSKGQTQRETNISAPVIAAPETSQSQILQTAKRRRARNTAIGGAGGAAAGALIGGGRGAAAGAAVGGTAGALRPTRRR